MSTYRIYQFGVAPLPDRMTEDDLSTGQADSTLLDSVGSVFDYYGSTRRLPRRIVTPFVGKYVGEKAYIVDESGNYLVDESGNRIIAGDAGQMLRAQVDAIRAMIGAQDTLYRRREDDSATQWKRARLLSAEFVRTLEESHAYVATVRLTFETTMTGWRSASQRSANLSGDTITADNLGNFTVRDAILNINATGTVTTVTVSYPSGVSWTWTGSMTSGQTLVVDAGALTVRKSGADAYSGFALGSSHTAQGWLDLPVGTTYVRVTADGPITATLYWYDIYI